MVSLPLATSDWRRSVAQSTPIKLLNRYFEQNPANQVDQVSLLTRPGLKRWLEVGTGPIRGIYSQPGSFSNALFVISGEELYRIDTNNVATLLGDGFFAGRPRAFASMSATAAIGSTPAMLFIADGQTLWLYLEDGFATGVLSSTGAIVNGDQVRIGDTYYQWTSGSVNSGTPAGTSGAPWLVALGGSNAVAFDNMRLAINAEGTPGTTYSTALVAHPTVFCRSTTATSLVVQANDAGAASNAIVTTETGANIAWGAATLEDGGTDSLTPVAVPDDLPAVSVGFIAGYTIVVIGSAPTGFAGRFFWIEPGETFIRPLNFATAERSPDPLSSVRVIGDQFWLFGTSTTEIWYPTGNFEVPFARIQGQLFDRGIVEGTDVQIKDSVVVVDTDGVVYMLRGGQPQRVSDHSIEQRIRDALRLQKVLEG
jgi:hypothetical protein